MEKIDIPATAQIDGHRSILQQTAIEKAMVQRPHLVILGAGATIAAIPNGDKNGKKSSVMNDFATNLNLLELLKTITLDTESNNIEDIYSELFDRTDEDSIKVREQLESTIRNYFETLKIPDDPTIYDYLLLSLTKKDAIVSFNWDDLLIQAYQRVHKITKNLPYISFLHGNVGAGYCSKCGQLGARRNKCPECGKLFDASPLLYPVRKKDYGSNLFISSQWEGLKEYISRAAVITIFGYSAPKTDTEAIKIFKDNFLALGEDVRILDRFEIIEHPDKSEEEIYESWGDFIDIVKGHVNIYQSFFDSLLAEFPRRSIEGFTLRYVSGNWGGSSISFKSDGSMNFDELKNMLNPLLLDEESGILKVR